MKTELKDKIVSTLISLDIMAAKETMRKPVLADIFTANNNKIKNA